MKLGYIVKCVSNMKLLLTSAGLSNKTIVEVFNNLVGLPNEKIKIVYIPTASNVEEGDKGWLIDDYTNLKNQKYRHIKYKRSSAYNSKSKKCRSNN